MTHGHEDHIGGVPYLLQQVDLKRIYGSGVAIAFMRKRLDNMKIKTKVEFIEYERDSVYRFKHMEVDVWTAQHSIPEAYGVRVKTPDGAIMDTGDFRFDYSPIGNLTDFTKLRQMGDEGLDILISDSTNSMLPEHSPTEQNIMRDLERNIASARGKVIFTTFASNMNRVKVGIDLAVKHKRKVCVFGRSMINGMEIAKRFKFIDVPEEVFVDKKEIDKIPDEKLFILSTGSQGEEMAALWQMASGRHQYVKLKNKDVVIFSSSPIPGNRVKVELLINQLYKVGAEARENRVDGLLHISGHAYKDEHKTIFNVTRPKYFIPYHGFYRQSAVHGQTAYECGVPRENIFLIENGQVVELKKGVVRLTKLRIPHGPIYIDSTIAKAETLEIIDVREKLAQNGFVNIIAMVDRAKREIIGKTRVISRGALYVQESREEITTIQRLAHGAILYTIKNNPNWTRKNVVDLVVSRIGPFFYKHKRRNPMVVVSLLEKKVSDPSRQQKATSNQTAHHQKDHRRHNNYRRPHVKRAVNPGSG
ncbi:ribonuclease J [Mycoplasma sp. ATU-Cv-508]|uniref:ribonuclease J n=1 Tax=Mycoplasma sp. ATU-Cv-508 TaxID=2048001 RepID=UPI001F3C6147